MLKKAMKLMLVVLAMLLTSITAYSQKTALSSNGDTTICFSVSQAKFLLKKYYEVEKYAKLDSVCQLQLLYNDSLNNTLTGTIIAQSIIIRNLGDINSLKDIEVRSLTNRLGDEKVATKKQKIGKYIAIGVSVLASGFFGYYIITH
jgi:hypothetical protein